MASLNSDYLGSWPLAERGLRLGSSLRWRLAAAVFRRQYCGRCVSGLLKRAVALVGGAVAIGLVATVGRRIVGLQV